MATAAAAKPEARKGALKAIGGSHSDRLNTMLANQAMQALWLEQSDASRNLSTTLRHRRFLFTDSFLLLWKWRVG